ncbi:MAG: hypothetical protein ACKOTZ_04475 [Chloroflexota bacterium]
MFQLRSRLAVALGAAIVAAAALAVPAGALGPSGVVWVAHGIPGVKVDVCVNGATARADFRYGNRFRADVPALTPLRVKVRAHVAGDPCTGAVLIREILSVEPGANVTALATLRAGEPRIVTWANNALLTTCVPTLTTVTVHHQAKAGPMLFVLTDGAIPLPVGVGGAIGVQVPRFGTVGPIPVMPGPNLVAAAPLLGQTPTIPPSIRVFADLTDYQLVLVGTNADNYRWIRYGNPTNDC